MQFKTEMDAKRVVGSRNIYYPPLEVSWDAIQNPLPLKHVQPVRKHHGSHPAPPWFRTGHNDQPFHFSEQMRALVADIACRFQPLAHIDVSRIIFAFSQARNARNNGLQARVTPLRFNDGELVRLHRNIPYQVQRFYQEGQEILYIVTFCLPRFLNRSFEDKFVTIFHELFHISPLFNGDLRRHAGRYSIHTSCQKSYDREMLEMARDYLQNGANPHCQEFLRLNFLQLKDRHGSVVGHVVPRPKLIPILPRSKSL